MAAERAAPPSANHGAARARFAPDRRGKGGRPHTPKSARAREMTIKRGLARPSPNPNPELSPRKGLSQYEGLPTLFSFCFFAWHFPYGRVHRTKLPRSPFFFLSHDPARIPTEFPRNLTSFRIMVGRRCRFRGRQLSARALRRRRRRHSATEPRFACPRPPQEGTGAGGVGEARAG